ncbi:Ldh family oxidoreductase [Streptomyces zagrosensis]|uniref:LDH2 family malate/lactate/ureidoglycolate dehydrogenase n=1 Tax=Streptomyces zagrosensis TaxID=1042984 RepID=A0A7W9QAB2_9ACTN|nr:Ldh family oxidoreductase [Streptomyces zagrosensis]MBB5936535.1 LDH2 family malate/lactate/ureidoglycolate dehydrogenase [Streptomyces zagrosensis]
MTVDESAAAYRMDAVTARAIVMRALAAHGVDDAACAVVADTLVETSMRGIDTHGVRLLPRYLSDLEQGIANPRPTIRVVRETGAAAFIDADAALGIVAGAAGTREVVQRAADNGVAAVVVRNSNHFGAASVYSRAMAREGMVGWVMTSAAARVAPYNGRGPLLGTNPVSVAAGAGDAEFALDMATSQVCLGEIRERGRRGQPLESGWATDENGQGTRDAAQVAALSPVGAGYKGQGLGMVVTLMTAVLADAPLDWQLDHIGQAPPGRGRGIAHCLLCFDPAVFGGRDSFDRRLGDLVRTTRETQPAAFEPVRCPGDPERQREREAARTGIPLDPDTARELHALAQRHHIPVPPLPQPAAPKSSATDSSTAAPSSAPTAPRRSM